ncbi:MAG: hypothetical protein IJZ85_09715 [Lachnospiraceae bacterium]|nr:hypothetical protein [Lachnospiraceae bacterium]
MGPERGNCHFRSFKESSEWQYFWIVSELNDKEFYHYMKLYGLIAGMGEDKEEEILITFLTVLGLLRGE